MAPAVPLDSRIGGQLTVGLAFILAAFDLLDQVLYDLIHVLTCLDGIFDELQSILNGSCMCGVELQIKTKYKEQKVLPYNYVLT